MKDALLGESDGDRMERDEATCNDDIRTILIMMTIETYGMRPISIATWNVNQGYNHQIEMRILTWDKLFGINFRIKPFDWLKNVSTRAPK